MNRITPGETTMATTFEITGYGRTAADDDVVLVAQTGQRLRSVPGRAVRALEAGDFAAFRKLYRSSTRFRLSVENHTCGRAVCVSYRSASLAYFPVPAGYDPRPGDDPSAAARALGLMD